MKIGRNQTLGTASMVVSLLTTILFILLYQAAGHTHNVVALATTFGKAAVWINIGAFGLAGAGFIYDKQKTLSVVFLLFAFLAAGVIGMYVHNI
jgi:hypothetical protein